MRAELSDINSIKLPRSEGTGFICLFFREEHIECDARIITDVSMVTTLGSLPGGQSGAYVYVRGGEGGRVQNPHV